MSHSTDQGEPQDIPRQNRARSYDVIHNWLVLADAVLAVGVLVCLMLSGEHGFSFLVGRLVGRVAGPHPVLVVAGYVMVMVSGYTVVFLPYAWLKGWWLEHRFHLSTQSFRSWLWDEAKAFVLTLLLALVVVEVLYLLLRHAHTTWWLWAAAGWIILQVILGMLFPVVILPLFYKTTRLDRADLEQAVARLASAAGVTVLGVFRVDLSAKTRKANAALAGIGRTRRILLGDTLLDSFSEREVLSVLAHEFGHFCHRHIPKLILAAGIAAVAGMWLADRVLHAGAGLLGIADVAQVATLPLVMLALVVFGLVTMPVTNTLARWFERQADQYALDATADPDAFIGAMDRLADRNLSRRMPHPVIEILLHSHPSIARRIAFARQWAEQHQAIAV